jgi:tetratricopeptide (TPR) repeat protein
VALARELGDRERLAEALMTLVEVAASRDEPTDIGDALREIEALSSERDPLRKQVQLARTQGVWALRNHDYAASIAAFRRQGELCRSSGNESGEHFAACNAANVYLDAADFDAAIEAARRAHEGLQRLRSPYGQNVALYYLVQGLAMRGDDDGLLTLAREVFNRTRSFEATGAPAMSAALCHARRGDAARAGLLAGYARSMVARTKAYPCPIDLHMRARLRECLDARYDDAQVEVWQQAGERLTDAQALAVGFDDAPVVNFLS